MIVLSLRDTGQQSTTYLFDGHATFQVGDEIVYVNGQSFDRLTHDEAVNVLKSSHHLDFVVRYIGKVPHSSLMPNRSQLAALAPNSNSSVSNNTQNPTTKVQSWNPYQVPILSTVHGRAGAISIFVFDLPNHLTVAVGTQGEVTYQISAF